MTKNEIQVFENTDFGNVRVVEYEGEPYFVGKDVAEILGYSNTRDSLAKHVDDEDKATVAIYDGSQNRNQTVINESGVYSLILSSKLPKAKAFKHWVTSEVIPSIRKTGKYTAPNTQPIPDMDKLSLTTQCIINLELQNNKLRKDLDNAVQRIEELERNITAEPEPEPEPQKREPKHWGEVEKDYLRKAYALGQSDVEIAADLGRTIDSISNMRRKLGLSGVGARRWTKDEDKRLKRLVAKGLTAAEIGKLMNRSADGVAGRKAKIINRKR